MTPLERIKLSFELMNIVYELLNTRMIIIIKVQKKNRAEEIVKLLNGPDYKLFPKAEVNQGYYHSSRQSEMIAENMQTQYYEVITRAIETAKSEVKTPEQEKAFAEASVELQEKYISKVKALAASRSGVMSSFMAGRSNFNSGQANRRGNAYDKVAVDFENWVENVAPIYIKVAVRNAMSSEQRQAEAVERQQAMEKKKNEKLERDSDSLWRIIEPKSFPFEYSSNMLITKINFSKEKLPSSITIAMKDGTYLTDNKIVLNKIFKNMPEVLSHLEAQGKKIPTSWSEVNTGK